MPTQKEIDKIKKDILEALEEPKKFSLMDLASGFYSFAISTIVLNVMSKSMKKLK